VTVELDIILNVLALEEHVFEDPVADCLIEALKKGSADRHDALEVPDFEGYSGYDSIQFESILIHSLLVLAFKVPTGPVEVLAVFVFLRKVRLSKMGLTKHVREKAESWSGSSYFSFRGDGQSKPSSVHLCIA
jgi:hypothetical protein